MMLFKIEAEVKRATRAIEMLEAEGAAFASKLEEVMLETETSKKSHGKKKIVNVYKLFYRVTIQVVSNLSLTPKQKFRFSTQASY